MEYKNTKAYHVLKYVISGGTAFLLYQLVFSIFFYYAKWPTFLSAAIAYLVSFGASFVLQKYWTFQDKKTYNHRQGIMYFLICILNLFINSYSVHLLVDDFHMYPLFASIAVTAVVSVWSYFLYKKFVFNFRNSFI